MADDPGVMGNLPRARPGRRSEKRAGGGGAKRPKAGASGAKAKASASTRPKATASRAKATASRQARPKATARRAPKTTAPRTAVRDERVEEREQGQDPLTAALRAGMAVGDAGVKVLSKIVQRLPRP